MVSFRYDVSKQMTTDLHGTTLFVLFFFTGVDEVISRLTKISLGGPKQLLTVENGVEDLREAFFEGSLSV